MTVTLLPVLVSALLHAVQQTTAGQACNQCDFEEHVEYAGGDLLPETFQRPVWWRGTWAGMVGVAPKLESKEECCAFCVEWNRQKLQPPCVVATFTLSPEDTRNLCFPKGPSHQPRNKGTLPRVACTPGPPCVLAGWGEGFLLFVVVVTGFYIGGGVGIEVRRSGASLTLRSHPHHQLWCQFAGLVSDGMSLTRNAGQRRRRGRVTQVDPEKALLQDQSAAGGARGGAGKSSKVRQKSRDKSTKRGERSRSTSILDQSSPSTAISSASLDTAASTAETAAAASTASAGGGRWVHIPT